MFLVTEMLVLMVLLEFLSGVGVKSPSIILSFTIRLWLRTRWYRFRGVLSRLVGRTKIVG